MSFVATHFKTRSWTCGAGRPTPLPLMAGMASLFSAFQAINPGSGSFQSLKTLVTQKPHCWPRPKYFKGGSNIHFYVYRCRHKYRYIYSDSFIHSYTSARKLNGRGMGTAKRRSSPFSTSWTAGRGTCSERRMWPAELPDLSCHFHESAWATELGT